MRLATLLLALLPALVSLPPALAQEAAESARTDPSGGFAGRINHAGYRKRVICSGLRLGGGHVVTANHCLPATEGDRVTFQQGYDRGSRTALAQRPAGEISRDGPRDTAVLCGAFEDGTGLPLARRAPRDGDAVVVLGYGAPRPELIQHHACRVLVFNPGPSEIHIDCPLAQGVSGGPVLIRENGGWAYLGPVSASGRGRALAYRLTPDRLDRLCPARRQGPEGRP